MSSERDPLPIRPGDVVCPFRGWLHDYEDGNDPLDGLAYYTGYVAMILSTGGDGQ